MLKPYHVQCHTDSVVQLKVLQCFNIAISIADVNVKIESK